MALVRGCSNLEQLFLLAAKIATLFASHDELLVFFEALCLEQIYKIESRMDNTTGERIEA